MSEVLENFEAFANNVVALAALDMGDEPYAASVVLVTGIIKTLLGGYSVKTHNEPLSRT
jgi:hypothetical protein